MARIRRTIPAIQGQQGSLLLTYQVQLNLSGIVDFLDYDPRDVFKKKSSVPEEVRQLNLDIQRAVDPKRRASIGAYAENRFSKNPFIIGGFPAVSFGFTYQPDFQPYNPDEPEVGALDLAPGKGRLRMPLDGYGRLTGLLDKLDEGRLDDTSMVVAATCFVPKNGTLTVRELGQIFRDMNFLGKSVSTPHAMALDHSDIYVIFTDKLAQLPVIAARGGMERKAHSLGGKSTAFVVQKDLFRFVRGACEGIRFQEANRANTSTPNLTTETFEDMLEKVSERLEGFASRMGTRFSENRTDIHRSSAGIQAVGLIIHDLIFVTGADGATTARVLDKLAAIDWSRYNPDWIGLLGEPDTKAPTDASGRHPVSITKGGRANRENIYRYLASKTGLEALRPAAHAAE